MNWRICKFFNIYKEDMNMQNLFTVTNEQFNNSEYPPSTIKDFTWHYNAQSSLVNMQLVAESIHKAVQHIGEAGLSKGN